MIEHYDITIGLEIHAELNTKTKAFCGCANVFGSEPNTNCCPVCLGFPDSMPKLNRAAVEKTIMAGLAFDCNINDVAIFERKSYFYPDLSKGYQISQLEKPVCTGGGVQLKNGKFARLNRIHLEEDAGKLIHNPDAKETMIDFNRGGVPLIEIVTEPDFSSAEEVVEFLEEVRARLVFAGVADCRMEEGGMRCDVNLSLKPRGTKKLGNRTETKNLNSFKSVARAIAYESAWQAEALHAGKEIKEETRKWNELTGKTTAMRVKETALYFPDPDLPAVIIAKEDVEKIKEKMPVLAYQLKEKFVKEFGLPEYDANILTKTKQLAHYYLDCVKILNEPKKISNWVMVDLLKIINEMQTENIPVSPKHLTAVIQMVEDKTINKTVGLQLLNEVIKTQKDPMVCAKELGLFTTISDAQIKSILNKLQAENAKVIDDYQVNKEKVLKFIIGYVMKNTQGKAKSDAVEKIIEEMFS